MNPCCSRLGDLPSLGSDWLRLYKEGKGETKETRKMASISPVRNVVVVSSRVTHVRSVLLLLSTANNQVEVLAFERGREVWLTRQNAAINAVVHVENHGDQSPQRK